VSNVHGTATYDVEVVYNATKVDFGGGEDEGRKNQGKIRCTLQCSIK
jgi:hypothetical protein